MGIERVLKENFPRLGSITSVNQPDPEEETPVLTVDMVTDSLQNILSAVKAMNGTVSIRDVDGAAGTVYLRFAGPPRLKKGSMHACMYVCMCVCMNCMYACMYVCMYLDRSLYMYA